MRQQTRPLKEPAEKVVQDIRRATRKHYSAEEKIRIVLEGLRGEDSIAELCRREGIAQNLYYRWSKDFLEAKKRLAGDTARAATSPGSVSQSFPEVPTAKQAGLDFEVSIWAGMFAPKGTPTNIIDKLANNLDAALEEPAVKNRLADLGVSSQKGGAFSRKIRQLCQI